MTTTKNSALNEKLSGVDAALSAAKARKAKRAPVAEATGEQVEGATVEAKPERKSRAKLSDEQKVERQTAKDADKAQRKADREVRKTAKVAVRMAGRKPAHMAKVQRAAEKLPVLGDRASDLFNEITAGVSRDQVAALALHLAHFNRVMATSNALATKLEVGMQVTISAGDPRFIGLTGTLSKVQRIRAYVHVDGHKKDIYVFTSDVTPVAASETAVAVNG